MSVYLVRNLHTLSLAGVFHAEDPSDLYLLLNEHTDPLSCEYRELTAGVFLSSEAADDAGIRVSAVCPGEHTLLERHLGEDRTQRPASVRDGLVFHEFTAYQVACAAKRDRRVVPQVATVAAPRLAAAG